MPAFLAALLTRAGWKQLGKVILAKHWEWVLIALLAVGGWGALQSYKAVRANLDTAKAKIEVQKGATELVAKDLVQERALTHALAAGREMDEAAVVQSQQALGDRERKIHALEEATQRAQDDNAALPPVVPAAAPDCRMPAEYQRVLNSYYQAHIAAVAAAATAAAGAAQSGAAADSAAAARAGQLEAEQRLHPAPAGNSGAQRDRQGDRQSATPKGH